MTATFEIIINSIRTGEVAGLNGVIKQVDFTVQGTESGQVFELPQTVELVDPTPETYIQLANVTEADVKNWVVENFSNMPAVEAHIQYVLDREIAKAAYNPAPLPWAPEPTPAP